MSNLNTKRVETAIDKINSALKTLEKVPGIDTEYDALLDLIRALDSKIN